MKAFPKTRSPPTKKAIELGADFVEVDLRETKDGQIISMHNDKVESYTKDAKGPVKSFTLADLKKMDIGSRHCAVVEPGTRAHL